jgi:peptide-methionine (S)-S-oxide reductase
METNINNEEEVAVFGGGCFWCTEAVFKMLRGVVSVSSGYSGGSVKNPTYKQVSTGATGHAEVIRIVYRPNEVSFRDLLAVFFGSHDPTTPNCQGGDVGTQYRSIILYTTPEQKVETEKIISEINTSNDGGLPVVTEVSPLTEFYEAESYHKNYFQKNPEKPYCEIVINPKLGKVQKEFADLLKNKEKVISLND